MQALLDFNLSLMGKRKFYLHNAKFAAIDSVSEASAARCVSVEETRVFVE